jgi:hypothetical protein
MEGGAVARKRSKSQATSEEKEARKRASKRKWKEAHKERLRVAEWMRYHEKLNAGIAPRKPLTEQQKEAKRQRAREWYLRFSEDKKRSNRKYYYCKRQSPEESPEPQPPPAPRIEKPVDKRGANLSVYFSV